MARMPESALPPMHVPSDGPPQSRLWAAKNPGARPFGESAWCPLAIAEQYEVPLENLLRQTYAAWPGGRHPP